MKGNLQEIRQLVDDNLQSRFGALVEFPGRRPACPSQFPEVTLGPHVMILGCPKTNVAHVAQRWH